MNHQAFSKIGIVVIILVLATGGILIWQLWPKTEQKSDIVWPEEEQEIVVPSSEIVELEGKLILVGEGTRSEVWAIEVEKGPTNYLGETIGLCHPISDELAALRDKKISIPIIPNTKCFNSFEKRGEVLEWKPLK